MKKSLLRLALSAAAAIGAAVVAALVLTIADLYLTGHGHASISREIIAWPPAGIYLSLADVLMLLAAAATAIVAWLRLPR